MGTLGVAITNGAAEVLARSPGDQYFAEITERNPVGRIGTVEDVAAAVLFALTNTFLTGQTLHVDGEKSSVDRAPGN